MQQAKRWQLRDEAGNVLSQHTTKSAAGRKADENERYIPRLFFLTNDGRWVEERWA